MRISHPSVLALVAFNTVACGSLLGIEELDPGLGLDGGSSGSDSGSNEDGGDGGSNGSGGASSGGAGGSGDGGSGTGGSGAGGTPGADAGDDSGLLPDGQPPSTTVEGRVLDFFMQPVAGVAVTIGSETVTTAADGSFTVEDVAATYDASLLVTAQRFVGDITYGWRYEGLTRRDPTLQVYRGRPEQTGTLNMQVDNVTFPIGSDQTIAVAFGTATGGDYVTTMDSTTATVYPTWRGNEATQGSAHALFWEFAGTQDLPTAYVAADTRSVGLDVNAPGDVTFDLATDSNFPVGSISGDVTNAGPPDRQNHVHVRYTDGASIEIVNDWEATNSFTYVVPTVQGAGITVAATGGYSNGPYAAAYLNDRVAGQSGLSLEIPAPANPVAPAQGASGITPDTEFRWTGANTVFVVWVEHSEWYEANFVVTANKETTLGELPSLRAGAPCFWYVETHGSFASVDAAAGPDGYFSSYSAGYPRGPRRESGTYTLSAGRDFTTAP